MSTKPAQKLGVVSNPSRWLPAKADILDSNGKRIGVRQFRDKSVLGSQAGYSRIIEWPVAPPPLQRTHIGATARTAALKRSEWPGSEVRTLVNQGPSKNRIDLTIMGDGYTTAEKDKFFADAKRIVDELFGASTFHSYLSLFNVHAVFVPSKTSGIGDGSSKDTALGLYRDSRMRQAVLPGNESAARRAAALAPECDYPIIVGNDKFYGGLGGEFAITTSAPLNTTTVLRHELGHNFGRVGEEYDGGQVYDGANHSSSSTNLPWSHLVKASPTPVHTAKLLYYSAPWKNLSNGDWTTTFNVPASAKKVLLDFNSLGFDTKGDAQLLVDGKPVAFDGKFNYDRNFYKVTLELPPGKHTVTVKELVKDGNNVLSKFGVYGIPEGFPSERDLVGAYGTYNEGNSSSGFRPTESDCLMRDMTLTHFCSACQENMWRNFLKEVSLIDSVDFDNGRVSAKLVPLGDEHLKVEWVDPRGQVRHDLDGKRDWQPAASDVGKWKVRVHFVSDEVKDPKHEAWSVHEAPFEIVKR